MKQIRYFIFLPLILLSVQNGLRAQSSGDAELLNLLNQPVGSEEVVRFALEYGGYTHRKFFLKDFQESQKEPGKSRLADKMVYSSSKVELGYSIPIDLSAVQGRINYLGIRGPQILEEKTFKANQKAWGGLLKRNFMGGIRFGMSREQVLEILGPEARDQKMLVVKDLGDSVTVHFLFRVGKMDGVNFFYLPPGDRHGGKTGTQVVTGTGSNPTVGDFSQKDDLHDILDLTPGLPEEIGAPGLKLAFIRKSTDPKQNGLFIESYCVQCPGSNTLEYADTWKIERIETTPVTPEMGPQEVRALLQGKVGTAVKVTLGSQTFSLIRNNYPIQKVTWKSW
ncbi:MAG: hypothetical protein H6581_15065 [Bacteroidia bacterium]|nr:hypothetical protein [Bacteroidia bacterium]